MTKRARTFNGTIRDMPKPVYDFYTSHLIANVNFTDNVNYIVVGSKKEKLALQEAKAKSVFCWVRDCNNSRSVKLILQNNNWVPEIAPPQPGNIKDPLILHTAAQKLKNDIGFGNEHCDFPKHEWRKQVADENTEHGYFEWVVTEMEYERHGWLDTLDALNEKSPFINNT